MGELFPGHLNDSNADRIVEIVGVFHFVALAFVCLRIYSRVIILKVFRVEDALIVIAVVPHGLGRHFQTIKTEDRTKFERITFWKTVISDGVAMGLLRISMAISLLRLHKDLKWYRWSLYGLIADWAFVTAKH
ncbi:hypothetical protein CSUB01_09044 [Colletotrichum sublineola]|uniref:Rhodopsin domain-containing protein n=1 Tax=Colletotrichum sublineola TaxID=1173701 RepID=A0A066X6V6_COLSU|nr:hypothetical protein CSUB01_09044 [Colletotrichum sublineola]